MPWHGNSSPAMAAGVGGGGKTPAAAMADGSAAMAVNGSDEPAKPSCPARVCDVLAGGRPAWRELRRLESVIVLWGGALQAKRAPP